MARLLLFWDDFRDSNEYFYRQEADAILIVTRQMLEEGDHLFDDDVWRH